MPFDTQTKRLTGIDAMRPKSWAGKRLCTWLESVLNDTNGPYAAPLGLTAQRRARATDNQRLAASLYKQPQAPPVVIVRRGDTERGVNGRVMITLEIDMGVGNSTDGDNVIAEVDADEMLVDFVADAIENNFQALADIGLHNTELQADAERQRAGNERNPHTLTFFVCVQKD